MVSPKPATTTIRFVAQHQDLHTDRLVPEDVRARRAKSIRDKLLGEDTDGNNKKRANEKSHGGKHQNEKDAHPHLTQMTKVLEEHIVHEELVDPNCWIWVDEMGSGRILAPTTLPLELIQK